MRYQSVSVYEWEEWESICLKHGVDPWVTADVVIHSTHDDYQLATYRGVYPPRPADHDDADSRLTAECLYCREEGWASEMVTLPGGDMAHPGCEQAVQSVRREPGL
jgi:hypothetical protein